MTPFLPIAAVILTFQGSSSDVPPTFSPATTAVAQRAMTPPVIDGKDNDEVWRQAQVISMFRQFRRSEEHTSELQSLAYLVCRLLLEKKKDNINYQLPLAILAEIEQMH